MFRLQHWIAAILQRERWNLTAFLRHRKKRFLPMARELMIELLVSASSRPHVGCLRRANRISHQYLRYASTVPSSNDRKGTSSNPLPSSKIQTSFSLAKVPLHVGLDRNPEHRSAISKIPIPKGERGEKFTPSVLARPLGLSHPPLPGQNSPLDTRTWQEKKQDFTDSVKAMERRKVYLRSYLRPYFQEWKRVDHWKGKSFVSNDRLFRRDKALYFPNMFGSTLAKEGDGPDGGRDTTNALMGKISVVGIQSGQWAEEQVDTFIGKKENPELEGILANSGGLAQRADINIQGDWVRALLVKLFASRLRQTIPKDRWHKYFMVKLPRDIRKGLSEEVRDAMGLLNSQVGYVYLLDAECKIRWAGSGHAWQGEVNGLNACIKRLLQEATTPQSIPRAEPLETEPAERLHSAAA